MLATHQHFDATDTSPVGAVSHFHPNDPKQILCRQMLTEYDEDELLYLEVEINTFLNEGLMTRRLMRLLGAVEKSH